MSELDLKSQGDYSSSDDEEEDEHAKVCIVFDNFHFSVSERWHKIV